MGGAERYPSKLSHGRGKGPSIFAYESDGFREGLNPFLRAERCPIPILRSIAQAMRLEGWPQTTVQAAVLRDASPPPSGRRLVLRMRSWIQ
jgi:hypothetical protein